MSRYMKIPEVVVSDKNLNFGSIILYGYISLFSLKKGYSYASNKYFSELLNTSSRTITRYIKELYDNDYIKISYTSTHGRLIFKNEDKIKESYVLFPDRHDIDIDFINSYDWLNDTDEHD